MKNYLKIIITIILFVYNFQNIYWYDIETLDWSNSKKNYCANNVKNTLWIDTTWNAYQYKKYVDKYDSYEIWEIIVIDRYNYEYSKKWTMWYKYWHIWIISSIDNNTLKIFDWYYYVEIDKKIAYWSISINKIYELWFNW